MSRRPAAVTQATIARALRAAGGRYQVEIAPDGTIRLIPLDPNRCPDQTDDPADWEKRLQEANPDWK